MPSISDHEIRLLQERWNNSDKEKLLYEVFIGKKIDRFRYLGRKTDLQKGYEWLSKIGRLFESNGIALEWNKASAMTPHEIDIPVLDLRGCKTPEKYENFIELFLPYADFSYSELINNDFSKSYFNYSIFYQANLSNSNFCDSIFYEADFSYLQSSKGTKFSRSLLHHAKFTEANLFGAYFTGAELYRADLSNAILIGADFRGVDLNRAKLFSTILRGSDLRNALITNVKWHGPLKLQWRQIIDSFEQVYSPTFWRKFTSLISKNKLLNWFFKLKILPEFKYQDSPEVGNTRISGADFANSEHLEKFIKDEQFGQELIENCQHDWKMFIIVKLWAITCDCGRSMFRWCMVSLFLAFIWGVFFIIAGAQNFELSDKSLNWNPFAPFLADFKECNWNPIAPFYYSVITFTTLGFGDITPKLHLWFLQILVMFEVILGYIMLGGLISIFANKLARRSA